MDQSSLDYSDDNLFRKSSQPSLLSNSKVCNLLVAGFNDKDQLNSLLKGSQQNLEGNHHNIHHRSVKILPCQNEADDWELCQQIYGMNDFKCKGRPSRLIISTV